MLSQKHSLNLHDKLRLEWSTLQRIELFIVTWQLVTACKLQSLLCQTCKLQYYRLDMSGTVKVADFGLSEDMYSTNYFRQGSNRVQNIENKVPIRWMPLESIEEGLYTEKSDVVSTVVYSSPHPL